MKPSPLIADNIVPLFMPAEPAARRPEYLDLAVMRARHGWLLGTLWVWHNRVHARREIQRLVLWAPESVLEDAGLSRDAAEREARRWFWQDFAD